MSSSSSIYRSLVWMATGLSRYTKSGYDKASQGFNSSDLNVDLTGRSFMVTGANSGIGFATCKAIAQRGGTIHMVCRNNERAQESKNKLVLETGNTNITTHILDLSKLKNVAEFAKSFVASGQPLHVLINNAGCMVNEKTLTEDGFEANFATNVLGPYILTTLLIPALAKENDPRVINVSSGGMLVVKLNSTEPQLEKESSFDGTMTYAQNKRQMITIMEIWSKSYSETTGVKFYSMHPGWADTPAVRESMPDFYNRMKNKLRSEDEGADTLVYLAVCNKLTPEMNGQFFEDRACVSTHLPLAWSKSTDEEEKRFYTYIETVTKPFLS